MVTINLNGRLHSTRSKEGLAFATFCFEIESDADEISEQAKEFLKLQLCKKVRMEIVPEEE